MHYQAALNVLVATMALGNVNAAVVRSPDTSSLDLDSINTAVARSADDLVSLDRRSIDWKGDSKCAACAAIVEKGLLKLIQKADKNDYFAGNLKTIGLTIVGEEICSMDILSHLGGPFCGSGEREKEEIKAMDSGKVATEAEAADATKSSRIENFVVSLGLGGVFEKVAAKFGPHKVSSA
ncbi:Uu.00g060920.m01.CDS01 [Anthostomella pinea]|uniref:Uu.00g060920.m01.CDS01 n=1 Tax=Anthostomella pinea TaxID=933095 RepID=A0AAI8VSC7_9PEZI|nr:Uu.00g060920.m01.CDS01 [Anthostomella pinea]